MGARQTGYLLILIAGIMSCFLLLANFFGRTFAITEDTGETQDITALLLAPTSTIPLPPIAIPEPVRAVYMTGPAVLLPAYRNNLLNLAQQDGINAVVVTVKDESGRVFLTPRMRDTLILLRSKNIYPIARLVMFEDEKLGTDRPELALRNADNSRYTHNGFFWVDPASKQVWQYNRDLALAALHLGFAEINVDYVRFPSDGEVAHIIYPAFDASSTKAAVIDSFAQYMTSEIHRASPGTQVSLDIFGYTFLAEHDLGIGQRMEQLARYFDVLAPMIYPSHFSPGNFGFKNPADQPYQVMLRTLQSGLPRLSAVSSSVIVRPWIQAFNLGAVYTPDKVKAQIQAIQDSGLTHGWMAWNAASSYTPAEFASP